MKNIFISSTFKDMQAERDMVQEEVIPALREEARKYGENVGVIDLRWGVDTSTLESEEGSAKVLSVCLDEIDRSHPYMLIFIGERYGWIPEENLIRNAVSNRTDKYEIDDYRKSVTALEIEYGALSERYGELANCIVCFREPMAHFVEGKDRTVYQEEKEEAVWKLAALKEKLKQKLGDRIIYYSGTWDSAAHSLVDFKAEGQALSEVLIQKYIELFRKDWKEMEALSWQENEQMAFSALMEKELRSFAGREQLLESYYQKLLNNASPLVIQGGAGSGKTAIMCKLAERLQKEGKKVFIFFAGAGNRSDSEESLIRQIVFFMENQLEGETHLETTSHKAWVDRFLGLSRLLVGKEKIYFCIDGLEQLYQSEQAQIINLLTASESIQLIVSCTEQLPLPSASVVPMQIEKIPALTKSDAKEIAEGILASYSRNAYDIIMQAMLNKEECGNPLYISVLIQRLNMMDKEDLYHAKTEQEIIHTSLRVIEEMPTRLEEALVAVLANGIGKIAEDPVQLREIINYLAVSRDGLRMQDLQWIYGQENETFSALDFSKLMKYLDEFFYIHEDNRIDFRHRIIRQGLLKEVAYKRAYEENIGARVLSLNEYDILSLREGMYYARILERYCRAEMSFGNMELLKNEILLRAIKEEALADEGRFYCDMLMDIEYVWEPFSENNIQFFLERFPQLFDTSEKEMRVLLNVGEAVLHLCVFKYNENKQVQSLMYACTAMRNRAFLLDMMGMEEKAYQNYFQALMYILEANQQAPGQIDQVLLADLYRHTGRMYSLMGMMEEGHTLIVKAMNVARELEEDKGCYVACCYELANHYIKMLEMDNIGAAQKAEIAEMARGFMVKLLETQKELNGGRDEELYEDYKRIGDVLVYMNRPEEALEYYKKSLKCQEIMNQRHFRLEGLVNLYKIYYNTGNAFWLLENEEEAFSYYKTGLEYAEEVYELEKNQGRLRELIILCDSMVEKYTDCGNIDAASKYMEKGKKLQSLISPK